MPRTKAAAARTLPVTAVYACLLADKYRMQI